jgi:hypothetical protein
MLGCSAHADIEKTDGPEEPADASGAPAPATPTPTAPKSPAPAAKTEYDELFAPAPGTPDASKIDGIWETDVDGDGVAKAEARLAFRGETLVFATRCTSSKEVITVGVTVKGNYADGTLDVLESKESTQPFDIGDGKTATCRAGFVAGRATYTLENGKLDVLGLTLSKVAE